MITENLSTLKIHKLSQAQYDRELAAGRIDANALYITPDEAIDYDDRYYTETEIDIKLSNKADSSHGNHVPEIQPASDKVFLRNDNTWATITPANIGAAESGHTHTASEVGAYSKEEINNLELITVEDIDTICNASIMPASEVTY